MKAVLGALGAVMFIIGCGLFISFPSPIPRDYSGGTAVALAALTGAFSFTIGGFITFMCGVFMEDKL